MARRRLAPAVLADTVLDAAADVPRAEHHAPAFPSAAAAGPPISPMARVAAEAAGQAALEEMAETLRRARDEGRMVLDLPLDAIAPDHLARDRVPVEDEEMAALRESLRLHGQRTPIEVTPLAPGGAPGGAAGGTAGALPYGLISGWRRLAALKALLAATGDPRFATVQALVRRPESAQDAYIAMVEENEIRLGLSHYERARVAARATERGIFPSEKAALLALFATASRPKRSRIRAFLELYHALDGCLRFPAALPERLGLRLVEKVREGEGPAIADAIARADPSTPEAEAALLEDLLAARKAPRPDAPAETLAILPGVELAAVLRGRALTLKLEGPGVTPELRDRVLHHLAALAPGTRKAPAT